MGFELWLFFKKSLKAANWHTLSSEEYLVPRFIPSQYLLVQSQQWKHENNVSSLLKVNNKGTRRFRIQQVPRSTPSVSQQLKMTYQQRQ